jgi:uncharacterized protein
MFIDGVQRTTSMFIEANFEGVCMSIFSSSSRSLAVTASGLAAVCIAAAAQAQTLSSPIGGPESRPIPSAASSAGLTPGQGPGVHGANSPFAPLQERADVVPWYLLTAVKTKMEKNRIVPVFTMDQMALRQKTVRVQGFMMPLDPGEKQTHFLLSSVPPTCAFCMPGGPESLVEVKTKTAVRYSMEPVVVEGRFAVLEDDRMGLYYRMVDAASVK